MVFLPAAFPNRFIRSRTIIMAIAMVVPVFAQSVPRGATPANTSTAPVVLSPFEVRSSQDHGYRVGAAVTGTGTAGLIRDTPLNISIVSQELIQDQAGNQLIDVLRG